MTMVTEVPELVPARMLNEYAYCPRLFFLEWVDRLWAPNSDTAEGDRQHRRVDAGGGAAPLPDEGSVKAARSVELSSERLGIIAQLDLLEGDEGGVVPVDTKKGRPGPGGTAWEADAVQVCASRMRTRAGRRSAARRPAARDTWRRSGRPGHRAGHARLVRARSRCLSPHLRRLAARAEHRAAEQERDAPHPADHSGGARAAGRPAADDRRQDQELPGTATEARWGRAGASRGPARGARQSGRAGGGRRIAPGNRRDGGASVFRGVPVAA